MCRPRPAVALPSCTGGEQRRKEAPSAGAGATRASATSTPCAVRTLQSLSPAELAAGSAARQHRVPPPARRDHARRSRHAPSVLCSRSPQLCWRRAVPLGSITIRCCRRRVAIAQDEHATCRLRSAVALPSRDGRGPRQCRTAASGDSTSAPPRRSRMTSTSRAIRALQSLSREGSAARQH